jgi:NAD(P)H-hydrate epimerase
MPIERVEKLPALPPRPSEGHKGLFGRLLVVGGNEEMIGAPVLAGMAALRMGSGLVSVAMPKSVLASGLCVCPELIGLGLAVDRPDVERLADAAEKADAVVVGPGIGTGELAKSRLRALVGIRNKPVVVDADGLNLLAALRHWPEATFRATAVLTPHPGEMKRLMQLMDAVDAGGDLGTDEGYRVDVASRAASEFGHAVVLKGHRTVVSDGRRVYVNTTGDSSLSKAGTGDVLSGVIGCLLGQKVGPFDAACLGVWVHGRAGEIAGARVGRRAVLARDVADALGEAATELERSRP